MDLPLYLCTEHRRLLPDAAQMDLLMGFQPGQERSGSYSPRYMKGVKAAQAAIRRARR